MTQCLLAFVKVSDRNFLSGQLIARWDETKIETDTNYEKFSKQNEANERWV